MSLHPIRYVVAFVVRIQTCIAINIYRIAFDDNRVAIDPYCVAIDILYSVQCFSVPEFDKEIEGIVYKRRRVLTTLALTTEGAYSYQNEDPVICSDDEDECQFERVWPDVQLPKAPVPAPMMSEEIKATIISDMLSQHSTACKVLDLLGVDACAQHKRNSAVAVLARVSKGNRLCTICNTSLCSTQALRTHIQGQHMEVTKFKCSKCDYSGGDAYSLKLHQRTHDPEGKKFSCTWPHCGRSYGSKGHLNQHYKQHQQGRTPPCPYCGETFSCKYGYDSHMLSCAETPGGPPEKKHKCDTCDKKYYRSCELLRHQKSKGH